MPEIIEVPKEMQQLPELAAFNPAVVIFVSGLVGTLCQDTRMAVSALAKAKERKGT